MTFLFSLPGGAEWLVMLVPALALILCPILAIIFYTRSRDLKKQLDKVTRERDELMV
jgi:hypothetical protein